MTRYGAVFTNMYDSFLSQSYTAQCEEFFIKTSLRQTNSYKNNWSCFQISFAKFLYSKITFIHQLNFFF